MLSSRDKKRKDKNRDQKSENRKEETSFSKKISDLAESALRFFSKKKAWSESSYMSKDKVNAKYTKMSSGRPEPESNHKRPR